MIISVPTGTLMCSKPAVQKPLVKVPAVSFTTPASYETFGVVLFLERGYIPQFFTRLFDAVAALVRTSTGATCACFRL